MRIGVSGDFKTSYLVGESFDPTGMVVTAYYNDSTRETVTDYTLSKTGALEKTDTVITVSYSGKTVDIPIDVRPGLVLNTLITVPDDTTKTYTAEAEAINFDNCVNSNNYAVPPTIENPGDSVASGGRSVGALSVIGNKFGFIIHSEVEATATLIMRASATHTNIVVTECMELLFNEAKLETDHVLHWTDGGWFNWENVEFTGLTLKEGDNTFTAEIIGPNAPNLDCFYLIVNPQEEAASKYETFATILDATTREYKIEAESLDYSECKHANDPSTTPGPENNTDGGKSLSAFGREGNTIGFNVKNLTDQELTARVVMRASANNNDMVPGEILDFTHNGTKMTSTGKLEWTGEWNVCQNAIYDTITLKPGNNEFELVVKTSGAPNIDYFLIELADGEGKFPTEEEPDDPQEEESKYETFATISDPSTREYKIEAEELDYSECKHANNPETTPGTESNTDGGTNLSAFGREGNTIGFNVKNSTDQELTAHVVMRASANNNDMIPGTILDFTHNGVMMTSLSTLKWTTWNVCGNAIYDTITLKPGNNEFELVVKNAGAPNIDYFLIELADGEGKFPTEEDPDTTVCDITIDSESLTSYKVEAENLDYSGCKHANNPETTPGPEGNTDGGTNLSAMGRDGNRLGFTVRNSTGKELKIKIKIRASANGGNMALDDIIKLTWNGAEIKTGDTLTWSGTWNQCEDAETDELVLKKGVNSFWLEVGTLGCPNLDYFEIIVVGEATPAEIALPVKFVG